MKTNELRIGNYVNIEGDVVKVKEIYEKSIYYANGGYENYATEDFIHPIDLTEEVLVKIGFKKIEFVKNEQYKYCKKICIDNYSYMLEFIVVPKDEYINLYIIEYGKEGEYDEIDYYYEVFTSDKIKNLHQLQNAYYLLTNEELEVEL